MPRRTVGVYHSPLDMIEELTCPVDVLVHHVLDHIDVSSCHTDREFDCDLPSQKQDKLHSLLISSFHHGSGVRGETFPTAIGLVTTTSNLA